MNNLHLNWLHGNRRLLRLLQYWIGTMDENALVLATL